MSKRFFSNKIPMDTHLGNKRRSFHYDGKRLEKIRVYESDVRAIVYYPLDKTRAQSIHTEYKGKRHGKEVWFYPDGKLRSILYYKHDKLHGNVRHFFPTKQLKEIYRYYHGKQYGQERVYYENGKLRQLSFWKDGKPYGAQLTFYESGRLMRRMYFENGVLHGCLSIYFHSGSLKQTAVFQDGNWDNMIQYYENGSRHFVYHTNHKSPTSGDYILYNTDNSELETGTVVDQYLHGRVVHEEIDSIDFYQHGIKSLHSTHQEKSCHVCFEPTRFETECGHALCERCCEAWSKIHSTCFSCPTCRSKQEEKVKGYFFRE